MAVNPFFEAFNATLPDLEASFTENWILKGVTYPAIDVDIIDGFTEVMKGGQIDTSAVKVYVRDEVMAESGVVEDNIITVRGRDFLVYSIADAGDASKELDCRTPQLDVWRT